MRTILRRAGVTAGALALLAAGTAVLAPTASASPTAPLLGEGSAGTGVKCVQGAVNVGLISRGEKPLAVDGIYGPATKSAVRAFQGWLGLSVDGVVGPITGDKIVFVNNEYDTPAGVVCFNFVPTDGNFCAPCNAQTANGVKSNH
jgi:peptidoglycan hydrolase-like protein with peptidoglycan-binding domain